MAGILDSKSRILDNIITLEGRRQLSLGKVSIEYVTFTDSATFYKVDTGGGPADATARLYLESCNLPQDKITFQADDSGLLNAGGPFGFTEGLTLSRGELIVLTGSRAVPVTSPTIFASQIENILQSSINNYQNLQILGTIDPVYDDPEFLVSPNAVTFQVYDDLPIKNDSYVADINYQESLFNDPRLSKLQNFKFLPPIVRTNDASIDKSDTDQTIPYRFGSYVPVGRTNSSNEQLNIDLDKSLQTYEDNGYMKSIRFDQTTRTNNLLCQIFETSGAQLKKLDIIDFGAYDKLTNNRMLTQRIFFAGRLVVDDNNTNSFIHIFTLVFE